MMPPSLTIALKEESLRLGFDLVGVCPATAAPGIGQFRQWLAQGCAGQMGYLAKRAAAYEHPRSLLDGVRSLVMLGAGCRTVEPVAAGAGLGRVSRYAWGKDYHDLLRGRLRRLAEFHRRLAPEVHVRGVVDTAPLLEREFAQLAGLGWIGKNTLLINRRLGSWFFLAALLTTAELEYDEPFEGRHCGTCRACLDACPTGALTDAYRLDARRCISYLTIELRDSIPRDLRELQGDWLFGCDLCQEVCPWNRRADESESRDRRSRACGGQLVQEDRDPRSRLCEDLVPGAGMNPAELAGLFALDDEEFRRRFRPTALWRARRRGLLRNAAIVLGNQPDAASLPALSRGLHDSEPLVRAACAWALGRYADPAARAALQERLTFEPDAEVRAEIAAAVQAG